jgi:tRNA threonylcarbamoyl adenosine modification protein (Sua5/YciO/YrdC/YwlC family)
MSTILHTNPINPQKRHVQRVVEALTEGKLVSFPTDTTYGIGCDLLNKRAIEKIYALKQRDRRKPLSILCADLKELSQYGAISNSAYRILRRLLPGPSRSSCRQPPWFQR